MTPERRSPPFALPQYSLTGDLLSFARCGLQYRYQNGSKLPPSRPVQMWFGEFIHGVLEGAYRIWQEGGGVPAFPWPTGIPEWRNEPPEEWPQHHIGRIGYNVEQVLRVQGKNSRNRHTRRSAYERAFAAVNEIGVHLFPLVESAEERIIGTRQLEPDPAEARRSDRYELHGIVDVITNVTLGGAQTGNVLRDAIERACPDLEGEYEVIVDYKGSRRPASNHIYWAQGDWQLQTYAWLRTRQPDTRPVAAGVLIYVNELVPGNEELRHLKRALDSGASEVLPPEGSHDWYLITNWQPGNALPELSPAFRYERAIRVVPVTAESMRTSLNQFDDLVGQIEHCVATEIAAGTIDGQWSAEGDEESCAACDYRYFCPSPHGHREAGYEVQAPAAP